MTLEGSVLAVLLQACAPQVAPSTLLAVIQVESRGNPYAIGVNLGTGLRRQPSSAADAIATAKSLMARGENFDAGLMQVNSANFAALGVSPDTVFDPCTNLRAGARLLADNFRRARRGGHAAPLQAALSEYNTGSRSHGLTNGYVGKIFAAAGQGYAPLASAPLAQAVRVDGVSPTSVARVLLRAFGGRITDAVRPINARYGAGNSYHKYAQAVDFVPRGGVTAINRDAVRRLMLANGIRLLELLGPGDPGHADHWHVAFATDGREDPPPVMQRHAQRSVAVIGPSSDNGKEIRADGDPVMLAASLGPAPPEPQFVAASAPSPPPAWDVFGVAAWQRQGHAR